MFHNTQKRANYPTHSKKKLQPIKKPLTITLKNQMEGNRLQISNLFRCMNKSLLTIFFSFSIIIAFTFLFFSAGYWNPKQVVLELIPFLKYCKLSECTYAQKSFILRNCTFRKELGLFNFI